MVLPCSHPEHITEQIDATIELLNNLNTIHPDILRAHNIRPDTYIDGLVFRSAVESIRGSFISSSTQERERMVGDYLNLLREQGEIVNFQYTARGKRCDYIVQIADDYVAGIEVKGGEGNSINISDRPQNASEFALWSHLDGALVNSPSHGAHSVIGRIANEMTGYNKQVDVLFFRDKICNSHLRHCVKYNDYPVSSELGVAPDIFLFPVTIPTLENRTPAIHSLDDLALPRLFLQLFEVPEDRWYEHIWEVHISLVESTEYQLQFNLNTGRRRNNRAGEITRQVTIWHRGVQVDERRERRI